VEQSVCSPYMSSAALAAALDGCRQRDEAAWRRLYDAHVDFLLRTARHLGMPDAEIEDVVHEVFVIAFRKLDAFQYGAITTWLYRICANVVSHRHRRARVADAFQRLGLWVGGAPPPSPEQHVARGDARHAVSQILARMSPKHREVLTLFELEGISGDEIAARLGCPVDTVWTRLHHARRHFQRLQRRLGYAEREPV
jgi:RNA polymerase sigma-70 factor, ECF subfamily